MSQRERNVRGLPIQHAIALWGPDKLGASLPHCRKFFIAERSPMNDRGFRSQQSFFFKVLNSSRDC